MKIAIVNDIHVGPPLVVNGKTRAFSGMAEKKLPEVLVDIQRLHSPDLFVNLGDLIRSENREVDRLRYRRLVALFSDYPVIHVVGNHELRTLNSEQLEPGYGLKNMRDHTILWFGLEVQNSFYQLPTEQVLWLEEVVSTLDRPTIVFSHCCIDDHNVEGNFFYETVDQKKSLKMFLKNSEKIREILAGSKHIQAVLQAHLHYFHYKRVGDIPYITCPAMGDNIAAPQLEAENFPEIYTILTCTPSKMMVKAYSREYCFAGIEP